MTDEEIKIIKEIIDINTGRYQRVANALDMLLTQYDYFRSKAQSLWQQSHCENCESYDERCGCLVEYEVLKDSGIECIHFERKAK